RLTILRDRIVELAHLQIQLSERVMRVRIIGNQLDVFLESRFGVWVINILAVSVAEQIEGRRELRFDLRGPLVVLNRVGKVLLPEVIGGQSKVSALVIRIVLYQLIEILLLFSRIAIDAGLSAQDEQLLAIRRPVRETDGLL